MEYIEKRGFKLLRLTQKERLQVYTEALEIFKYNPKLCIHPEHFHYSMCLALKGACLYLNLGLPSYQYLSSELFPEWYQDILEVEDRNAPWYKPKAIKERIQHFERTIRITKKHLRSSRKLGSPIL